MNSFILSICIGLVAALIDIIPMSIKKVDKLFICSAFMMWLIIGIVNTKLRIVDPPVLNGLVVSLLFFIPLSFLIYKLDNSAFLQVCISTILLGSLVGLVTGLLIK